MLSINKIKKLPRIMGGGGVIFFKNNSSPITNFGVENNYKNISKYSAFSLIELSIVLIIMGLLVAGITGGASLIKTAKLKTIIDEIISIKTAYNTFYLQYGRVPGSTSEDPYNITPTGNYSTAANELKEKGFIDNVTNGLHLIRSKKIKANNFSYALYNGSSSMNIFKNDNVMVNVVRTENDGNYTRVFSHKDAKSIDTKIDDGLPKNGDVKGGLSNGVQSYNSEEYSLSDAIEVDINVKFDF
jgi:prepilin-type N-terminal cleavage/methylation domain-containing protein